MLVTCRFSEGTSAAESCQDELPLAISSSGGRIQGVDLEAYIGIVLDSEPRRFLNGGTPN